MVEPRERRTRFGTVRDTHFCGRVKTTSALAAYALGRYSFRGSTLLAIFFLSGLLLPFRLLGIAVDSVFKFLHAILLLPARVLRGPTLAQ